MQDNSNTPLRICSKCKILKDFTQFHKNKSNKNGISNQCISCKRTYYKPKDKIKGREQAKKYALAHPERVKDSFKRYYDNNKEYLIEKSRAAYRLEHRQEAIKKWHKDYRPIANARRREKRENLSPKEKVEMVLRRRFKKVIVAMKKGKQWCSWRVLIGCSVVEIKEHIEKQFVEGMSWENHGNGHGKWNIDHIKPLYSFNLMDLEQQKIAFHYTNTRPLWWIDNMRRPNNEYPKG